MLPIRIHILLGDGLVAPRLFAMKDIRHSFHLNACKFFFLQIDSLSHNLELRRKRRQWICEKYTIWCYTRSLPAFGAVFKLRRIEQFLVGVVNYRLLRQYSSLGLELTPEGGVNTITVHPEGSSWIKKKQYEYIIINMFLRHSLLCVSVHIL